MINTSNAYKEAIRGNREFCIMDEITFSNGTRLTLETGDFMSYSINEATSSAGKFEVGAAVIKEYSVTLNNMDGKFDEYDFEGADILAKVGLKLADGTWEILQKGRYRVVSAKASELTIQVKAYDSMLFFDRPYSESDLSYPAALRRIIQNACNDCGMSYSGVTIEMADYVVTKRPDDGGLTYRDIISYCAQIMGCYARIDHMDKLAFGWYEFDSIPDGLDGGNFEGAARPYETGDVADGGNFDDYSSGYVHDGGTFLDAERYHHFYNLSSQSINTDDITITGVAVSAETEGDDPETCLYGTDDYALALSDNPLIQEGKVRQVAEHVGSKLVGVSFRPLNITVQSDPCIEAGDAAVVTDRKQRSYRTVITNTTFAVGGLQKIECSAETPTEKSYTKYGAVTKLLAKVDKQTGQKLSAYDIAVKQMNQLAANTMGFYSTVITQPDGSVLAYRHDKPKLAESKTVYKSGIDGFFVTQDYQGTDEATTAADKWKSGFDANGNAVLNILSAIGINADWINAGYLSADHIQGGMLILGGKNNGNGRLSIEDASGKEVGYIDNTGVHFNAGSFSGTLDAATGSFAGELKAATGTFAGELKAATGSFSGNLQAAGGTFSGTLQAATGSFEGNVRSQGETFYVRLYKGQLIGGTIGEDARGYIDFRSHKKDEGSIKISTDGRIEMDCDDIYVKDSDSGNSEKAQTKDIKVMTDIVYGSDGTITKHYTTLHFLKGLLVSS